MTHTPGPWKAHRTIWDKETGDVAYILEGVKEARAADSYLITAAPDMLEALEGAKWLIECYVSDLERNEEYKDVVRAIKKARGEE